VELPRPDWFGLRFFISIEWGAPRRHPSLNPKGYPGPWPPGGEAPRAQWRAFSGPRYAAQLRSVGRAVVRVFSDKARSGAPAQCPERAG
jgi:hypothetical protein